MENKGKLAGLAAAAAAAVAGAYWFYGSENAPKHRQVVRSWMLKARAEVLEAVEKLGDVDKRTYLDIVDRVLGRYSRMKGVTSAELRQAASDLKGAWQRIQAARESGADIGGPEKPAPKKRAPRKTRRTSEETK